MKGFTQLPREWVSYCDSVRLPLAFSLALGSLYYTPLSAPSELKQHVVLTGRDHFLAFLASKTWSQHNSPNELPRHFVIVIESGLRCGK